MVTPLGVTAVLCSPQKSGKMPSGLTPWGVKTKKTKLLRASWVGLPPVKASAARAASSWRSGKEGAAGTSGLVSTMESPSLAMGLSSGSVIRRGGLLGSLPVPQSVGSASEPSQYWVRMVLQSSLPVAEVLLRESKRVIMSFFTFLGSPAAEFQELPQKSRTTAGSGATAPTLNELCSERVPAAAAARRWLAAAWVGFSPCPWGRAGEGPAWAAAGEAPSTRAKLAASPSTAHLPHPEVLRVRDSAFSDTSRFSPSEDLAAGLGHRPQDHRRRLSGR